MRGLAKRLAVQTLSQILTFGLCASSTESAIHQLSQRHAPAVRTNASPNHDPAEERKLRDAILRIQVDEKNARACHAAIRKRFAVLFLLCASAKAQEPKALPQADEGYKADIRVVVAHPDDEGAVTPYLARTLDEHRRIAVVYGTRGSSGSNEAGAEQSQGVLLDEMLEEAAARDKI